MSTTAVATRFRELSKSSPRQTHCGPLAGTGTPTVSGGICICCKALTDDVCKSRTTEPSQLSEDINRVAPSSGIRCTAQVPLYGEDRVRDSWYAAPTGGFGGSARLHFRVWHSSAHTRASATPQLRGGAEVRSTAPAVLGRRRSCEESGDCKGQDRDGRAGI